MRYPPVIREQPTGDDLATWGEFVERGHLKPEDQRGVRVARVIAGLLDRQPPAPGPAPAIDSPTTVEITEDEARWAAQLAERAVEEAAAFLR